MMKYLPLFLMLFASPAFSVETEFGNPILSISLYGGRGIPAGWEDSTTRPDATDACIKLIRAMPNKERMPAVMKARCIVKIAQ